MTALSLSLISYSCSYVPIFSSVFVAAVTYIDSSAVQALKDLHQEYKLRDIQVEFPPMQFQMLQEVFEHL